MAITNPARRRAPLGSAPSPTNTGLPDNPNGKLSTGGPGMGPRTDHLEGLVLATKQHTALTAALLPPRILSSRQDIMGPAGFHEYSEAVRISAARISNLSGALLTVQSGRAAQGPATAGAGVRQISPGCHIIVPVGDTSCTVYGPPGTLYTVDLYSKWPGLEGANDLVVQTTALTGAATQTVGPPAGGAGYMGYALAGAGVLTATDSATGKILDVANVAGSSGASSASSPANTVVLTPAVGTDWTYVTPVAETLVAAAGTLMTSAVAGNRGPRFVITDNNGHLVNRSVVLSTAQAASSTRAWWWLQGVDAQNEGAGTNDYMETIPADLVLPAGWTVGVSTQSLDAGDQWSNVLLTFSAAAAGGAGGSGGAASLLGRPLHSVGPLVIANPAGLTGSVRWS